MSYVDFAVPEQHCLGVATDIVLPGSAENIAGARWLKKKEQIEALPEPFRLQMCERKSDCTCQQTYRARKVNKHIEPGESTNISNPESQQKRKNKSKERSKNLSRSYHKDTLVLTIAGCNKVVYNGFIKTDVWIMNSWRVFSDGTNQWNQETYFFSRNSGPNEKRYLATMASDLEAFSR